MRPGQAESHQGDKAVQARRADLQHQSSQHVPGWPANGQLPKHEQCQCKQENLCRQDWPPPNEKLRVQQEL